MSSARRIFTYDGQFRMHRAGYLESPTLAYETWGELNEARDNAILIFTGLSPSAHASSCAVDPTPGWWEEMIGTGLPLDTDRFFVICVNSLGHLRQLARQLFWLDRACVGQPGNRQTLPAELSRPDTRGCCGVCLVCRATARRRRSAHGYRLLDGWYERARILFAPPGKRTIVHLDLVRDEGIAVLDCRALLAARDDSLGSEVEKRSV
jgi:hypothetical protein